MPGQFESILDKLQAKLGKQTIRKASTIARPKPKFEVQQIKLFNEFAKRNPRANGGLATGKRGSDQVFSKKGKKVSEALKEKRVLSKDMKKYLKERFPKVKNYKKFYRNASTGDIANWKKALPSYIEIKKIPNIEKAGKFPFGTTAVGGYVEKVKLIKQFNELKPTFKTHGS